MGCNKNCGLLSGIIIGAALAILGGILIPVGNNLIGDSVKKEVVIENGTNSYENWFIPGSPIYRQVWVFDVQNPEEVMKNGSDPILQQKGPYTYSTQYTPKENITEHEDNTLSYFRRNIFLFEPSMSNGTENDTFTTINLAVVIAPVLFPDLTQILNPLIQLSNSKLLQTRTVKEILWGYEDPFLKLIPIASIEKVVGIFYPLNETLDGPYQIYTGKDEINKAGIIHSYKNNRTLDYWKGYCAMVNGTDGASFHPFISKDDVLYFFSSDICRSLYATFDGEQIVKNILLYRFNLPSSAFMSPTTNPDNMCFCDELTQDCSISGTMDLSPCKEGKPIYITLPHFLQVDERILQFVKGLKPNVEEHGIFLNVEPITGFTMNFAKRLQINILATPNSKITSHQRSQTKSVSPIKNMVKHKFQKVVPARTLPRLTRSTSDVGVPGYLVKNGYRTQDCWLSNQGQQLQDYWKKRALKNIKHQFLFPVLWLNETAVISDEKAEFFRSSVTDKIKFLNIAQIVLITLGSVMFLGFFIAFFTCRKKSFK